MSSYIMEYYYYGYHHRSGQLVSGAHLLPLSKRMPKELRRRHAKGLNNEIAKCVLSILICTIDIIINKCLNCGESGLLFF